VDRAAAERTSERASGRPAATVPFVVPIDQLPLRIRPSTRLSDDALFELCRTNRDLRIERTAEGELVIMAPTGGETGARNFSLIGQFYVWVRRNGEGIGFDSSTGFVLPNGAERSPDVAWVRKDRWEALTPAQRRKLVPLCPDFVIELVSPSDDTDAQQEKMREYLDNGASLGWLIDPDRRRVHVYRAGGEVEELDGARTISGEPLLVGLVVELDSIW
jgi:Uma2 family endonuclease